jgi:hypothetical protein
MRCTSCLCTLQQAVQHLVTRTWLHPASCCDPSRHTEFGNTKHCSAAPSCLPDAVNVIASNCAVQKPASLQPATLFLCHHMPLHADLRRVRTSHDSSHQITFCCRCVMYCKRTRTNVRLVSGYDPALHIS